MREEHKILHVINSFGMGGAETWLLEMLKYGNKHEDYKHIKMEFLCTSGQESVLDKEIIKYGGKIHYITFNKEAKFSFISKFRKLLKRESYEIIHDHQDFLSGWHFLFGIGLLPKIRIAHVHNPSIQIKNNYGISPIRRMNQKIGRFLVDVFATYVGGTSLQVLNEYGFDTEKPKHIAFHCAFNLENYRKFNKTYGENLRDTLQIPKDHKVILFVGRLDMSLSEDYYRVHKNSIRAIKMFNALSNKNTTLLMAGNNTGIKIEYEGFISELGLDNRIQLLGIRNDVSGLMIISDILLFPSKGEGLGMVAVEAQAANLHVVASTAVPSECVVIDELVTFIDLELSDNEWSNKIESIISSEKQEIPLEDKRWVNTDFNIINSLNFIKSLIPTNEKN